MLSIQKGLQLALPDRHQAGLSELHQLLQVPLELAQVLQLRTSQAGVEGQLDLLPLCVIGLKGGLQAGSRGADLLGFSAGWCRSSALPRSLRAAP